MNENNSFFILSEDNQEELNLKDTTSSNTNSITKPGRVLYFSAQWCNPCNIMTSTLKTFSKAYPNVNVIKIDVDDFPTLATDFNIKKLPTLVLQVNNQEVTRESGLLKQEKLLELFRLL